MLGLALAGHALGGDWTNVRKDFEYVDYAIVALHRRRRSLYDRAPPAQSRPGGGTWATDADAVLGRRP